MSQTAKLFRNGRSQAVRLPAEFRFEGKEVYIRRDAATGDVILSRTPGSKTTFEDWLELGDHLRAEAPEEFQGFMEDRRQEPPQEREFFQ
ncbi:MAG TPA: hypothetical protein VHB45_11890 [Alloacidobacterium sp.]|nr:hypothetical protein [Alloacidobacterium sp.]